MSGRWMSCSASVCHRRIVGEHVHNVHPCYRDTTESEHSQTLELMLGICRQQQEQIHRQQERIHQLEETVAQLKDEIAILKGEKARPKIKPSTLNQDESQEKGRRGKGCWKVRLWGL